MENGVEAAFSDDHILVLVGMVLADPFGPEGLIRNTQKILHSRILVHSCR